MDDHAMAPIQRVLTQTLCLGVAHKDGQFTPMISDISARKTTVTVSWRVDGNTFRSSPIHFFVFSVDPIQSFPKGPSH